MSLPLHVFVATTLAGSLAFGIPAAASADAGASTALTGSALARFPAFAELSDSRTLNLPVMLQGTLTNALGQPLSGAQVLASAWPSNDAVGALPKGGQFDLVPIARTVAGKNGAYELHSLLTPLLASLIGDNGLDIELDVFHGERQYVYLSQVRMDGAAWVRDTVNGVDAQVTRATGAVAANLLDLVLDPVHGERLNASASASKWPPAVGDGEPPLRKRDRPIPGGSACSQSTKINAEGLTSMTTVATAIVSNGVKVDAMYTKGAKTVTSTGFSFDGGVSFGVNGARERTSSFSPDFRDWKAKPGQSIARDYRVEFEHDVFRRVCVANANWNEYRVQYLTSPRGLTGGGDDIKSRYPVFSCGGKRIARALYDAVKTENAKAATYEAAFGFAPVAGGMFSGSALSGYSDAIEMVYSFSHPARGWWCGNTGKPLQPGQRLHGYEK